MRAIKRASIFLVYIVLAVAAHVCAYLLLFDFGIPRIIVSVVVTIPVLIVAKGVVFLFLPLRRSRWQMAGIADLIQLLWTNFIASMIFTVAGAAVLKLAIPRGLYVLDFLLCFLLMGSARFFVRVTRESVQSIWSKAGHTRILIYGAGSAGVTLLREIQSNPALGLRVAGFIDDDPKRVNSVILGVRVIGTGRDIAVLAKRASAGGLDIREVVIAMPSATGREMREALANCRSAGVACKTIPGLGELLTGKVLSAQVRTIAVTDLLGRDPVQLDARLIKSKLTGRSVLVTGGAGSIGAELCRQIANFTPECLVILDQAESDLFRIELELRQRHSGLRIIARVGDIRDASTVHEVMSRYSISAVFHAAAYKHVPMMETNVIEALANNVVGTWNVACAARRQGVETFLMISTDKAVRPANVMGASKRAAELVVRSIGKSAVLGPYVSVRFGNVLGSNGSVVPLFQQQIAAGGPVTVTHPEMRRYFMTIPEAVQLVLQASAMGKDSEIFVLNMGEAVRISDLARNMIKLAGYEPDEDIEIRYIGTRPGEKLFEELMLEGEHILPTYHDKIKIFRAMDVESASVDAWMNELMRLLELRQERALIHHLKRLVPEYQPAQRHDIRTRTEAVASV
jgi:FlaA1/EpsC-like NDP-sugar epimerase